MKRRDIWKLAVMRARTSAGRRTSFTIAIGLMLLLPVVWLLLGFYGEIYADIDDTPPQLLFVYEYRDLDDIYVFGSMSEQRYQNSASSNILTKSNVESSSGDKELAPSWVTMLYEQGELIAEGATLTIDHFDNLKVKAITPDSDGNYLPADTAEYLGKTASKPVTGAGFSSAGNEIYASARLLEKMGLSSSEALGKKLSLRITLGFSNDQYIYDDNTVYDDPHSCTAEGVEYIAPQGEVYVFYEFTVVGVIENVYYENVKDETDIWVKRSSIYLDGADLMPKISVQDIYNEFGRLESVYVLTYPHANVAELAEQAARNGAFIPLFSELSRFDGTALDNFTSTLAFVQYNDFSEAVKAYEEFLTFKGGGYNINGTDTPFTPKLAQAANNISTTDIICAVFGVVGIVTFAVSVINYMNAAAFNLRKRRAFLDMMKKIGITEKDRRTLIFFETAAIYVRAAVLVGIVTLILIAIGAIVITMTLPEGSRGSYFTALAYVLPAALIIAAVMAVVVGIVFAYITAGENRKKDTR